MHKPLHRTEGHPPLEWLSKSLEQNKIGLLNVQIGRLKLLPFARLGQCNGLIRAIWISSKRQHAAMHRRVRPTYMAPQLVHSSSTSFNEPNKPGNA